MARARAAAKSDSAFRTISEVSDHLQVPQHVLRFWETKFDQVQPMKRGGGRRYYRPEDIELLRQIRDCLYADGYTIKGVQKLLREGQITVAGQTGNSAKRKAENPRRATSAPAGKSKQAETGTTDGSQGGGATTGQARLTDADRRLLRDVLSELEAARADLDRQTPPRRDVA